MWWLAILICFVGYLIYDLLSDIQDDVHQVERLLKDMKNGGDK